MDVALALILVGRLVYLPVDYWDVETVLNLAAYSEYQLGTRKVDKLDEVLVVMSDNELVSR